MTYKEHSSVFGIEVNFLTGRYIATQHNDMTQPEWPPHPARLFSALTAVHMESSNPDPDEQAALEWLETLSPPSIRHSDAAHRRAMNHFVPVNDTAGNEKMPWKTPFPDRVKHARHFPSVAPKCSRVTFIWENQAPDKIAGPLDRLLEKVTRLGHSSSLVSCRLTETPPIPTISPTTDPATKGEFLRTFGKGQLAALKREYEWHQGTRRPRPLPFLNVKYAPPVSEDQATLIRSNLAGTWIAFELEPSARLVSPLNAQSLTAALRARIFRFADDPIPEDLSGHQRDGKPTRNPAHIAFWALPFVNSRHADGTIKGLAISIPSAASESAAYALYRAIGRWERASQSAAKYPLALTLNGGSIHIRRIHSQDQNCLESIKEQRWANTSKVWTSATPIALPRHPKGLNVKNPEKRRQAWAQAEHIVAQTCVDAGLPLPEETHVRTAPYISGARASREYPSMNKKGNRHMMLHARVSFSHPVKGPFALGSGRFRGWGLMSPLNID